VDFLMMRRADFVRLRDWNAATIALFEAHDVFTDGAVLINAPDYLTPDETDRRFLLGTEGVLYVDETLDYNQQFWMNSGLPDTQEHAAVRVIGFRQIQRNEGVRRSV
jgi:hypothetical protein